MSRKIRIKLPQAQSGIEARMKDLYTRKDLQKAVELNQFGKKSTKARKKLKAVPRPEANLEAEGGETAVTNLNRDGIAEIYDIDGPRHNSGGVPLSLKEDSFIFSDTRSMKIKDPKILKMFGMSEKAGGYTPAQISKKFDLNKYKKILLDPESDNMQRETAELMITNYNRKLGLLALMQESMKGYPQGIPLVATPFLASMKLDPNTILGLDQQSQQQPQSMGMDQGQEEMPTQEDQGMARYGKNIISKLKQAKYGYIKAKEGIANPNNPAEIGYESMQPLSTQDLVNMERQKQDQEQIDKMNLVDTDIFKTSITGKEKTRNPYRADTILAAGNLVVSPLENLSQQSNIKTADIKTNIAEAHRKGQEEAIVNRGYYDVNQGNIEPRKTVPGMYSDVYVGTSKYGGPTNPGTRKVRIKLPKAQKGKRTGNPMSDWWYNLNRVQNTYKMYNDLDPFLKNWYQHPETQRRLEQNLTDAYYTDKPDSKKLTAQAIQTLQNTPIFSRELVKKADISASDLEYNNELQGWKSPNTIGGNPYYDNYNYLTGVRELGQYDPKTKQIIVNSFNLPGTVAHEGVHAAKELQDAMERTIHLKYLYDKGDPKARFAEQYGSVNFDPKTGERIYEPFETVKSKYPYIYEDWEKDEEYLDEDGMYPRIMDIRRTLNLKPGQKVDKSILENESISHPLNDLKHYYDDDTIINMLNTLAKNNTNQKLNTAAYGGELNKLPKAQGGLSVPPQKGETYKDWATKSNIPISDNWYATNLIWDGTAFIPRVSYSEPRSSNKKVVTTTKTTRLQNIPEGATKHDESSADFNPKNVKVGDYVKGKDGKWRKATQIVGGGLSGASLSGPDNYKQFYGTDIDSDIAKAKAMLEIKSKTPKSGITKVGDKYNFGPESVKSLSLEEKELLTKIAGYHGEGAYGAKDLKFDKQKENTHGLWGYVDPELLEYQYWKARKENWNKNPSDFKTLSPEAKKANRVAYLKKLGYTDDELTKYKDKLDDPNKLYTKEFVYKWRKKDSSGNWTGAEGTLVDRLQKFYPPETFRPNKKDDYALGWEHADFYHEDEPTMKYEDVPEDVLTEEEKAKADEELKYTPLDVRTPDTYAPFFAQDVLSTTGAAMDLARIKKRLPWQASWNLNIPTFVPYDPTRELAANSEIANIGTQGAQLFSGQQAYNARYSQIQGQAAKNAADILSRYNNLNVGIANQYEREKAQLLNQDEMNRANAATNLFDKTIIANEMYDSQKNMARQNLRNAFRDAITNRANAQVLNTLFPQFHINPMMGGMLDFMGGRELDPTASETDVLAKMDKLRYLHPGWTDDVYRKVAMGTAGTDTDMNEAYLQQYQNMMSGTNEGTT